VGLRKPKLPLILEFINFKLINNYHNMRQLPNLSMRELLSSSKFTDQIDCIIAANDMHCNPNILINLQSCLPFLPYSYNKHTTNKLSNFIWEYSSKNNIRNKYKTKLSDEHKQILGSLKAIQRNKKTSGIKIDNTPMVDVAFLLLTFFMLTTTLNKPQTMEINLPPSNDVSVEVAQSNLMTIRVREEGTIYWNVGVEDPQKIGFKELGKFLVQKNQENPKLITLVKIDRKGKYSTMVDIMDELNMANVTRFSLAPMQEADKRILAKLM